MSGTDTTFVEQHLCLWNTKMQLPRKYPREYYIFMPS